MCLPNKVKGYTVQAFAVLVGNLLNLNFGLTIGVTAGQHGLYESAEGTPLNRAITSNEATWVAGSLFLSAAFGSFTFGLVSSKIGPKSVMLLSGLLQITSWFCIHFAFDVTHIYASRVFAGIAAGAAFTVLPLYISEIAETTKAKASLTVSLECGRAFGILIGLALGMYLRYAYVAIVGIVVSIVFSMTFPFVQESPYYFLRKGNMASFEKSLRWFRGIRNMDDRNDAAFQHELNQIKHSAHGKAEMVATPTPTSHTLRLLIVNLVLAVGVQLGGIYVFLYYGSTIRTTSTAPLKVPNEVALMVVAVVHLLGTIVANCISGIVNRRILLFVTSLVSALCLLSAAMFLSYGNPLEMDGDLQAWVMPLLLTVHILFASIGYFSFSTTILVENIPRKRQCRLLSLLHLLTWLMAFVLIQFYVPIVRGTSTAGLLLIFAIGCLAVTVGSLFSFATKLPPKEIELKINGHSVQNGHFTNTHI